MVDIHTRATQFRMFLCDRYRHHYLARQHEISLFEGVLPLLTDLLSRHH